jgi:hypothetical protein
VHGSPVPPAAWLCALRFHSAFSADVHKVLSSKSTALASPLGPQQPAIHITAAELVCGSGDSNCGAETVAQYLNALLGRVSVAITLALLLAATAVGAVLRFRYLLTYRRRSAWWLLYGSFWNWADRGA